MRDVQEITREGDGHRSHAASLRHQQQRPAVNEGDCGMIGLTNVRVLPIQIRTARGQLRVNEGSGECDQPAQRPGEQDQRRRVHLARNHVGVDENAGADNAAHDDHGGVEQAQAARQFRGQCLS